MEEQAQEVEALAAIYGEDFNMIESEPHHHFTIHLLPLPGQDISVNHVELTLEVRFTPDYPQELPKFWITDTRGISEEQKAELEQKLTTQAEGQIGSCMVFDLATTCKEWLDDNNVDPQVRERQRLLQEEEERERRRQEGTPVTPETFARWIAEWERLHPPVEIKRHKPTGRQLFESNAEMVYSDAAFTEQEPSGVDVDWSLFKKELENVDLDELDQVEQEEEKT